MHKFVLVFSLFSMICLLILSCLGLMFSFSFLHDCEWDKIIIFIYTISRVLLNNLLKYSFFII